MLREENCSKFCGTYVTFYLRNFMFFIIAQLLMCATFFRFFSLRDLLKPGALKANKSLEWGMSQKFEKISWRN